MASIIRMPSVLAGSEEAAIANWLVAEGQKVEVGDPLAEIETEKAIVEYNAEAAGILGRVVLAAGEAGEIGTPIAVLIAEGETSADIDAVLGDGGGDAGAAATAGAEPAGGAAEPAGGAAARSALPVAVEPAAAATVRPATSASAAGGAVRDPESASPVAEAESVDVAAERAVPDAGGSIVASSGASAEAATSGAQATAASTSDVESASSGTRLFVSPIARKLARDAGIDPASISGTGPGGRIVRRDVEAAAAAAAIPAGAPAASAAAPVAPVAQASAPAPATPAPTSTGASGATAEWDLVPHTGMRKAIARRLTESKSTVPHFYLTTECVVDDLLALRAEVNAQSPVRVSVNDFVVKAVAAAFAEVPEANVTWSDEGMRVHHAVDIAVAVATDGGLVTPVVRGVDTKSLTAVSSAIAELVGKAKDKRLKQGELEGGSFSVSNLGMYGTVEFSAILNPPQSGILAVGAAKPQAIVVDGEVRVATVMRCTLSVDHRAVDGALAARWLAAFTARIENPLSILL
jgi:pyruvate dehydrogenase E2 component (dihydrolipoamide acetyltransferase)